MDSGEHVKIGQSYRDDAAANNYYTPQQNGRRDSFECVDQLVRYLSDERYGGALSTILSRPGMP
jgi:hypothetical protein